MNSKKICRILKILNGEADRIRDTNCYAETSNTSIDSIKIILIYLVAPLEKLTGGNKC